MTTYIITEKQNTNSTRKGEAIQAKSLTQAKRAASRMQGFEGTVMTIESENGHEISYKEDGKWVDFT